MYNFQNSLYLKLPLMHTPSICASYQLFFLKINFKLNSSSFDSSKKIKTLHQFLFKTMSIHPSNNLNFKLPVLHLPSIGSSWQIIFLKTSKKCIFTLILTLCGVYSLPTNSSLNVYFQWHRFGRVNSFSS